MQGNSRKRVALSLFMADKTYKSVAAKVESVGNQTYKFIISSEVLDRSNEIVSVEGIDYTNYLKNPVVLLNHDSYDGLPVGKCLKLEIVGKDLVATMQFHDATEEAISVEKLVAGGYMSAVSIGFIPLEWAEKSAADLGITETYPSWSNMIRVCTKSELLEFSIVNIPCNPEALITNGYVHGISKAISDGKILSDDPVVKMVMRMFDVKQNITNVIKREIIIQRKTEMKKETKAALLEGDALTNAGTDCGSAAGDAVTAILTADPYNLDADSIADIVSLCIESVKDVIVNELGEDESSEDPVEAVTNYFTGRLSLKAGQTISAATSTKLKAALEHNAAAMQSCKSNEKCIKELLASKVENSATPETKGTTTVEHWTSEEIKNLLNL